mmetsp:Transcript_13880/g.27717  ORF Transcript_13880/g.27717 Transcript_13880/m.27717 type:complete len:221 (-) Transcript_13880:393-1055(-)
MKSSTHPSTQRLTDAFTDHHPEAPPTNFCKNLTRPSASLFRCLRGSRDAGSPLSAQRREPHRITNLDRNAQTINFLLSFSFSLSFSFFVPFCCSACEGAAVSCSSPPSFPFFLCRTPSPSASFFSSCSFSFSPSPLPSSPTGKVIAARRRSTSAPAGVVTRNPGHTDAMMWWRGEVIKSIGGATEVATTPGQADRDRTGGRFLMLGSRRSDSEGDRKPFA